MKITKFKKKSFLYQAIFKVECKRCIFQITNIVNFETVHTIN